MFQKCAFAAAAAPHNYGNFPLFYLQIDVVQNLVLPKSFRYVLYNYHIK